MRRILLSATPASCYLPTAMKLLRKLAFRILAHIQRLDIWPMRVRARMFRLLGSDISSETLIAGDVFIEGDKLITKGSVAINIGVHIDALAEIRLEDGVRVGHRAMLLTSTHDIGDETCRAGGRDRHDPIAIGAGTWIGAGAIILPGVTVGAGCVIAAGAVVNRDTEPNGVYAGVPARLVRRLSDSVISLAETRQRASRPASSQQPFP